MERRSQNAALNGFEVDVVKAVFSWREKRQARDKEC